MGDSGSLENIPAVDAVVRHLEERQLLSGLTRRMVVRAVRRAVSKAREAMLAAGPRGDWSADDVRASVFRAAEEEVVSMAASALRPMINATGVIVHTNLGRAPLSRRAVKRVAETASGYASLEYDAISGGRGRRDSYVREALCELVGAEDAAVTNNNAAAVMLALNTLALGRDVVVSRSELIEIGGSFRLPDVFEKSGARMVAVGTTNRTHPADYERAITNRTAAIMAAHWSNYSIVGFVERVPLGELASICRRRGLPLIHDLGSGILGDAASLGLAGEMTISESLGAGASVVTASGDKILGGPQAGLIVGGSDAVGAMRANPLLRALRPGKLTLAALQVTLEQYLEGSAPAEIPVLRSLLTNLAALRERAERLVSRLEACDDVEGTCSVVVTESRVGGGAAPERPIESAGVALDVGASGADALAARLRGSEPPVVARTVDGRVVLDLRTVHPDEDESVFRIVCDAMGARR